MEARILMDQWGWAGWTAFGIVVVFAGIAPVVAKRVKSHGLERGMRIAVVALTALAAAGPFALLGHGSVDGIGNAAERKLQDRYVAAMERNRDQQRRTALVNCVSATLSAGVPAEDRVALDKALSSIDSAAEAVGMDERYLEAKGVETTGARGEDPAAAPRRGAGAATQTALVGGTADEPEDLIWHAMTIGRWSTEQAETVAAESAGPDLDSERAKAIALLQQTATNQLGLSARDNGEAIDAYFTGTINFALDHFSAGQLDREMNQIASAICRLSAARELDVRQTVARLYQQAMVANTIVPWQPSSQTRSPTAKTIIIRNDSPDEAMFSVVGPIVKETTIEPGEEARVTLDESEYHAVVSVGSATPIVLELGYGSGQLKGEITKDETWVGG